MTSKSFANPNELSMAQLLAHYVFFFSLTRCTVVYGKKRGRRCELNWRPLKREWVLLLLLILVHAEHGDLIVGSLTSKASTWYIYWCRIRCPSSLNHVITEMLTKRHLVVLQIKSWDVCGKCPNYFQFANIELILMVHSFYNWCILPNLIKHSHFHGLQPFILACTFLRFEN